MTAPPTSTQRSHQKAVRFFWGLLISASAASIVGNVAHATLAYIPRVLIQIGAAAVPPIALIAAVHGIGLAVRAGASGTVYRCAVTAVGAIGLGAFAVSFLALRELMREIGYSITTAWVFPAIIDTAVAVSTLMLVALGDKPPRRARSTTMPASARTPVMNRAAHGSNPQVMPVRSGQSASSNSADRPEKGFAPAQLDPAQTLRSPQAEMAQGDADLAAALIASGVTTQSGDTVVAVLAAHRAGASINAAARASGINYRTAQRIVEAAVGRHQPGLVAVG
jgi:Protein of unknown function (DUF2637)